MKQPIPIILLFLFASQISQAQIINGQDTLYGNEWINYDQSYFKIMVAEDGMYRLPYQVMVDGGVPVAQVDGSRYQLFHNGEEVPIYTTTNAPFGDTDYLEFYGKKNTSELDRHLFQNPDEDMMNPLYSLFTDTAAYFLTWRVNGNGLRYEEVVNDLGNLPGKEEWCWFTQRQIFNNAYDKKKNTQDVKNSFFDVAEGYASGYALTRNINFTALQPFQGGQDAKIDIRYGCGLGAHAQILKINGIQVASENLNGYGVRQSSFDIPNASLSAQVQLSIEGTVDNNDRHRVAFASLKYPRLFDFGGAFSFAFELNASTGRQYMEITNFSTTFISPILYDLTNGLRLKASVDANNLVKAVLPPSSVNRMLVLLNANTGSKLINSIRPVYFVNYFEKQGDYVILSNAKLFDDGTSINWVQEYANYRSTIKGGSFKPVILEIQQVYDQFGWGVNRNVMSIRNLVHFIKKKWQNPRYVFIIGKAREMDVVRSAAGLNNQNELPFLVPTFGLPGSDNLLAADKSSLTPLIPIGRIAATQPDQIRMYLDKIKQAEANISLPQTIADRAWMKRVLHLGGGAINDNAIIKEYLRQMEDIIENNQLGADVHSFYKTSSDPIQISRSQEIFKLINEGVSIITFFGHSGTNTFDFSLDSPENYENTGKYPLFFSLGCYSGQIHSGLEGVSERFVFEENKGAIAFMSSTSLGYISALRTLCGEYYNQMGGDLYGKGIGEILLKAIKVVEGQNGAAQELIQQFTLHGDPAYVLNPAPGPDYVVNPASVAFTPAKINVELDSFEVSFKIQNIGRYQKDSMVIEVRRDLPGGVNILMGRDTVLAPPFEQDITFKLPTLGETALGLNRFYIKVDAADVIAELPSPAAEQNNDLETGGIPGISTYFFSNDVRPVFPKEFGIVNTHPVVLKASTSNTFADERLYLLELDTSALFNSPFKRATSIQSAGGVLRWAPNANFKDSTVYYWRVTPDSIDAAGYAWRSSSFLYLENAGEGWNQSHYFQYQKDNFKNMELSQARRWKFLDDVKDVSITTGLYPTVFQDISINNNSSLYIPWDDPIRGGFMIAVLDSTSVDPWRNIPTTGYPQYLGLYNSQGIPNWVNNIEYSVFPYTTRTELGRKRAMTLLDSIVPDNNYVVIITATEKGYSYEPEEWEADSINNNGINLFNLLEGQGATLIRESLVNGASPYWFIYKKNDPSFPVYEGFASPDVITSRTFGLPGFWDNGNVESPNIGPAEKWDQLIWSVGEVNNTDDRFHIDVIGIKEDKNEEVLISNLSSLDTSLTFIDPMVYPYLRLRFSAEDTTGFSPPQLKYWRVLYQPAAELALNPAAHFQFYKDTIQQGDLLSIEIAAENLGTQDADSLQVRYRLTDASNEQQDFVSLEPALSSGESFILKKTFQTTSLLGNYDLAIEINPYNKPKEEFRFNNLGFVDFFVKRDERNPLLDVWFDGFRINNGDIVSAKPHIQAELQDENPFLPLTDTSTISVFLKYPDETELRRISFSDGQAIFKPADLQTGKNKASIELEPIFEKDGIYELLIQSQDASGNQSGTFDYRVAFEVITKSSISNFVNYPNPFTTSTRFLYTMTGSVQPVDYKVQIMTVSGRIVKEITKTELGTLNIGTHLTDYVWDGRDEYGDQLAKGVYLYRVLIKDEQGKDWESYDNGTDKYFKAGFGKMVLLR
ncbi:MAG: C25 family cysteine peptidase [Saprospiraceae bacterium]